jgi:transcriptional regulator with XRE-family HTH domain
MAANPCAAYVTDIYARNFPVSSATFRYSRFPLFAAALRDAMDELPIKGRALASLMEVREQTVSEWRKGSYRPEGADLLRLAGLLKVPPETLRRDDGGAKMVREGEPQSQADAQRSADYWRGVLFAAETMSETVTRLLRQQREAADRLAAENARRATQLSAASAQIPHHSSESPRPDTG